MRKSITALLLGILFMQAVPTAAQSRSVFWERWDVLVDNINTVANEFTVTESYDLIFSGTFRFGSAAIPLERIEAIRDVRVSEGGQPLRESCSDEPGTYCVLNLGSEVTIKYTFFQPITNGRQRFEIRYRVIGALRVYPDGDQLWWTAIPSEHYGFTIGSSRVTVQLPPGFGPRADIDPVVTYGVPAEVSVRDTTVTAVATRQISGNEYLEIRVQYPHDPSARMAVWQSDFDRQRAFEENTLPLIQVGVVALSLLLLVGGLLGLYALWYTRGRDPKVGPVPTYLSEPPSSLPPAVVGALLDEKADLRDVISTIIDLAQRGYIVMEEEQQDGILGLGKQRKFTFKRTDKDWDDLRRFEKHLMMALFGRDGMQRSLDSMKNVFYASIPHLQNNLYEALVEDKLFATSPNATRALWQGIGSVVVVLSGLVLFGGFSLLEDATQQLVTPALLCIPVSLGLVGFSALIFGQFMPAKTRLGAEEAAKWRAFREYLTNLEKYADAADVAARFAAYLPYAVAFGLDRSWVRRFSQLQQVPIPHWYYPTYLGGPWRGGYRAGTPIDRRETPGSFDPGGLARAEGGAGLDNLSAGIGSGLEAVSGGLTQMLESASRVMTSRPQSDARSGSSGSWGSGGRSWSGGGSRGGGSSGGGRRGFG